MALEFSKEQLRGLMNDYYGGYRQTQRPITIRTRGGRSVTGNGYTTGNDTKYYKNNADWRAIGDELGININSTNDLSQLYNYFDENYVKGNGKKGEEATTEVATPEGLKPGDPGFTSEPNVAYGSGMNADGTPQTQYDYSKYNKGALLEKAASQISTGFYDQSLGVNPEIATQRFGHADLAGNLEAGQSASNLLAYFDSNGGSTLNADQKAGKEGGIYEQVKAMAELEKPLDLIPLPRAGGPVGKMNIAPASVGNAGNASGVRAKRSKASKYGRNAMGTSQFNRKSFGSPAASSLTIGGLNI